MHAFYRLRPPWAKGVIVCFVREAGVLVDEYLPHLKGSGRTASPCSVRNTGMQRFMPQLSGYPDINRFFFVWRS